MIRSATNRKPDSPHAQRNHLLCGQRRVFDAVPHRHGLSALCLIFGHFDPAAVYTGRVTFYPIGFSLRGFEINLQNAKVLIGFANTLLYTVSGTALSLAVTLLTAFALSRHELIGRSAISLFFAFTMWFSGGLIPFYLLVRDLGMYNTPLGAHRSRRGERVERDRLPHKHQFHHSRGNVAKWAHRWLRYFRFFQAWWCLSVGIIAVIVL